MSNFKFPTTLPIDITFFNAESVSPDKLNNIFAYIKAGIYALEMFMGNGIDYSTLTADDKKLIGSLTNSIGTVAGNVYMPYNHFHSLYRIYKDHCSTNYFKGKETDLTKEHAIYDFSDHSLSIKESINIPINHYFKDGGEIGAHFSSTSDSITLSVTSVDASGNETLSNLITGTGSGQTATLAKSNPTKILSHKSLTVSAGQFVSHITLDNSDSATITYKVYSLYYSENINGRQYLNSLWRSSTADTFKLPYNSLYAIGLDHKSLDGGAPSYCTLRYPCKFSATSLNQAGHLCDKVAGTNLTGNCTGNTYDIYVDDGNVITAKKGLPVCAGSVSELHTVQDDLKPRNSTTSALIKYDTSYEAGLTPSYRVIQSPLIMYPQKGNMLRFHPMVLSKITAGQELETGRVYLYNVLASDNSSPISYSAKMFSTNRPDVLQIVSDNNIDQNGTKYIVLTSEVGISEMSNAFMYIQAISNKRNIAVYAD